MPEIRTELTTTEFWATFPGWVIGALTFVICGYLAVYFLGANGFCTYACHYGAIFGAAERLAPMRIRVTDACAGCGHCTAVCTSNVRVHEEVRDYGMVVDSGCMKCLDCVSVCPNDALYYGAGPLPIAAKKRADGRRMTRFPLSWAEEGVAAAAFAAAFFTFRGLYGQVPFLMALGLAGVLAYLVLLTFQLATRPNLKLKSWRLKRLGALQPPAFVLLGGMALLLAFWLHSAVVRYHTYAGDVGYRSARAWGAVALDVAAPRPELTAAEQGRIERGFAAFDEVRRLGWFDSQGADAKRAWMAALLGRDAALERHAKAAIENDKLIAEMHQLLGRLAFEAGDPVRAANHFEHAVAADGHDLQARINLGVAQAQIAPCRRYSWSGCWCSRSACCHCSISRRPRGRSTSSARPRQRWRTTSLPPFSPRRPPAPRAAGRSRACRSGGGPRRGRLGRRTGGRGAAGRQPGRAASGRARRSSRLRQGGGGHRRGRRSGRAARRG